MKIHMEDIDIICKQTGKDRDTIIETYQRNKHDIINTICELEKISVLDKVSKPQFSNSQYSVIPKQEIKNKLNELRRIVDDKDALLENMKEK